MVQALVAGGTGTAGRQVVKEFLARGHSVRVLTRHGGAPGSEIAHFHGDLVTGDGLAEALDGVDVVVDTTDGKTRGTRAVLEKGGREPPRHRGRRGSRTRRPALHRQRRPKRIPLLPGEAEAGTGLRECRDGDVDRPGDPVPRLHSYDREAGEPDRVDPPPSPRRASRPSTPETSRPRWSTPPWPPNRRRRSRSRSVARRFAPPAI